MRDLAAGEGSPGQPRWGGLPLLAGGPAADSGARTRNRAA